MLINKIGNTTINTGLDRRLSNDLIITNCVDYTSDRIVWNTMATLCLDIFFKKGELFLFINYTSNLECRCSLSLDKSSMTNAIFMRALLVSSNARLFFMFIAHCIFDGVN